ncbi:MAG TPA: hypothetical protein VKG84_10160 [Candidatus Acidoferrales bacterium]|nr:hypothetical protein [Candidatus Acidoferrales bacterium]
MSGTDGCCSPLVVVKLGGSVLSSERAYSRAAEFLAHRLAAAPGERFVAVVSAQEGSTDALENTARGIAHSPSSPALHLLWSTGEIRSVALLTLHLEALGISAAPLNVHETGLRVGASSSGPGRATLHPARLHAALGSTRVAVVPGFLGTDAEGAIVALGRGGSDLTAVLLAAGLGASRCELVKDVPGYFSADPHRDAAARHLPALTFAQALALADAGCDLVQRQAIEAATAARLPILVRSLNESAPVSIVSEAPASARAQAAGSHPEPARAGKGPAFLN